MEEKRHPVGGQTVTICCHQLFGVCSDSTRRNLRDCHSMISPPALWVDPRVEMSAEETVRD